SGTFRTTEARHGTSAPAATINRSADNLDIGEELQLPPQAPLEIAAVAPTPEATPEPTPEPTAVPTTIPAPPQAPIAVPTRPAPVVVATPIPPAPPAAAPVALSSMEQEMYNLHNSERARSGLGSLRLDGTLTQIARQRAQDMATRNYFSHNSPTGQSAFTLMASYGYRFDLAGENIARNNYPDDQATQVA